MVDLVRAQGIEVLIAYDDGQATTADVNLLERATALGMILVTRDRDFARLAGAWQRAERFFLGVILLTPEHLDPAPTADELVEIAQGSFAHELDNTLTYVPLR